MKHKSLLIAVCSVIIVAVIGGALWLVIPYIGKTDEPVAAETQGTVVQPQTVTTYPVITQTAPVIQEPTAAVIPEVTVPSVTVPSVTVPSTTAKPLSTSAVYTTGFFNVVTDGTVGDDDSLSGLTGDALRLGKIILAAGFRYDPIQGIFYSDTQSWQHNFGFTPIYDVAATVGGMYYDTIRLKFTHGQYDYMFQLWKGRYGITTGGEMGLYYKPKGNSEIMYACAPDDMMMIMSFALYRNNDLYMTRGPERHWWLTGFKLFDVAPPSELTMHSTFFMEDTDMADALEKSIIDYGFTKNVNYQRVQNRITLVWN